MVNWDSRDTWDDDEAWEAAQEGFGPEWHMYAHASDSSEPTETIITEGAARAIESGAAMQSLRLSLDTNSCTLTAPDAVWYHLWEATLSEGQRCGSCREIAEVFGRAFFDLP